MSLLLDALKRAEQEKLARGERPDLQVVSGEAGKPSATPAASAAPAPAAAKGNNLELQPIAAPAAAAKAPSQQATAKAVFEAKSSARETGSRRGVVYAAAGSIAVAVIAAAAYVWYVMQSLSPARPLAARASAMSATPSAGTIAPAATPPAGAPPALQAPPKEAVAAAVPAAPAAAAPPALPSREQLMQQLLREPAPPPAPPLRLDRSPERSRLPAEVAAGYEALRKGDLAAARRAYQAALAADATNVDAALGAATVEARGGSIAAAAAHYRRVLEIDPRNQTAMAGLAALAEASRPGAVESQLRQDLIAHPQSAALRFALGNLLAAQARWSEAQAEYFEAHRLDPGNADVAHNLAVSLDHIGQRRLAADYYRRALAAAGAQPAQFDVPAVERRLAELGS